MPDTEFAGYTSDPVVQYRVEDGAATLTLDSQHNRNALSTQLIAELGAALDAADQADTRVLVLGHSGPSFCAGADLKQRAADGVPDSSPFIALLERLMDARYPTIAAVDGAVRAGGLGLMAACDLIVVNPAVSFALPEVRIGVAPAIVLVPLLRRVAPSQLAATTLAGEPIDAAAALRIGLVTHVDDDVAGCVDRLASAIGLGAPHAVAESKAALWGLDVSDRTAAFSAMQQLSESLFRSADAQEGMRAFAEKRRPAWVPAGEVQASNR